MCWDKLQLSQRNPHTENITEEILVHVYFHNNKTNWSYSLIVIFVLDLWGGPPNMPVLQSCSHVCCFKLYIVLEWICNNKFSKALATFSSCFAFQSSNLGMDSITRSMKWPAKCTLFSLILSDILQRPLHAASLFVVMFFSLKMPF